MDFVITSIINCYSNGLVKVIRLTSQILLAFNKYIAYLLVDS